MKNFLSNREKVATDQMPSGIIKFSSDGKSAVTQVVSTDPNGPQVELVTEKGVVQSIIITCKCGERMELKCHY